MKSLSRRRATRLAAAAFAVGFSVDCRESLAQSVYTGPNFGSWASAANWTPAGVPGSGSIVEILKGFTVTYNVQGPNPVDLQSLQLSGGTSFSPAELSLQGNPTLNTGGISLGAANVIGGTGPGEIFQNSGTVNMDAGSLLAIDSTSTYALSSTGTLFGNNEQNAGAFSENNGANLLAGGATLNNSGTYSLLNSGVLAADTIINSGFFNQSGSASSIHGTTGTNASFNNSGTYFYNTGAFTGLMTNNPGSLVSITGAIIPFSQGIINNGQMNVTSVTGTYTGPISGTGNLVFSGSTDNVTLAGTNSFTGPTSITGGTLVLAGPVGTAANNFGGGLQGNITVGTGATLQTSADSQISNNSVLTVNGGTVNLGTFNQSVGSLNMSAGQILQSSGPGLGVVSGLITVGSGSATINGGLRSANIYTFTVAGSLTVNGAISAYSGNISNGMILTGGGTMSLSGICPLKTVDVQQGILKLSQGGSFNGSNVSVSVESGGSFALNGQTMTIGDLIGSGAVALGAGNLTINSTGTTFSGTINGSGSFTKLGLGTFNLTGNDLTTGANTVSAGTLTVGPAGSIGGSSITVATSSTANINGSINNIPAVNAFGTVTFGANPGSGFLTRSLGGLTLGAFGQVNVASASAQGNRTLLTSAGLTLSGATDSWAGQLDLSNNDMVVKGGSLATLTNQIKSGFKASAGGTWNGTGIVSSAAAADTTHLTALGVIQNDNGSSAPLFGSGTQMGTFDGSSPLVSDVLIKYTYFGDANLDGKVDGSDYSLIDNGFLNSLTGWYNGDFNYDGTINGSDYTLIDNAFNTQGASLAAVAATSTAQLTGSTSVPEPSAMGLFSLAAVGLLKRRTRSALRRP